MVEGDGNYLMTPQVADVADVDREVAARLPLNVQRLVHGIGKLISPRVGSQIKWDIAILETRGIGQIDLAGA